GAGRKRRFCQLPPFVGLCPLGLTDALGGVAGGESDASSRWRAVRADRGCRPRLSCDGPRVPLRSEAAGQDRPDDQGALRPARPDQRRRRAGRNPQRRDGQPQGHAERRRHQQRFRAAPEWPRHGPRDRPDRRRQHADRQEQDRQRDDHDHQLPERRADLLRPADPALAVPGRRDRRAVQSARGLRLPVHAERRRRLPAVRPEQPAEQRRHDDDRPGQDRSVHRATRNRLAGSRPVSDRGAVRSDEVVGAVGAAGRLERQDLRHRRLGLRHASRRDHRARRDGRRGAEARVHGVVHRARPQHAELQSRRAGRVDDDGEGAHRRAVRPDPLHDRQRLLGGSIYQQQAANEYPGIFDGILPACSFPDSWSTAIEVVDCRLLVDYFDDPSKWAPGVAWPPNQQAAVEGHPGPNICQSWINVYGFDEGGNPRQTNGPTGLNLQSCNVERGVAPDKAYDPQTNPGGVRCDLGSYFVNELGERAPQFWGPIEQALGHGFVAPPFDNVGVQYGLGALQAGTITPAQFIDLNQKVGGRTIDYDPSPDRVDTPESNWAVTYQGGLYNEGNNMHLPIIDLRGH